MKQKTKQRIKLARDFAWVLAAWAMGSAMAIVSLRAVVVMFGGGR